MPKTYRIRDWSKHFENNRSKEYKHLDWVPIPNRMDKLAYLEFVDHPNAAAHLGAWVAMLEIASRSTPRGTFPQGAAGFSQALAMISRLPAAVFDEVIPRLEKLQWIESSGGISQDAATILQDAALNRIELNRIEQNTQARAATNEAASSECFEDFWQAYPLKQQRDLCAQLWISLVTVETEAYVLACLQRYLLSDQVARGVVLKPSNWLHDCSRDKWASDWPKFAALSKSKTMQNEQRLQPETLEERRDALRWLAENDIDPAERRKAAEELERTA